MAAEASSSDPSTGKIDVCDLNAVIRWDDDQQRGLGSSLSSTPVSLDIDFDPSSKTISFRLRIALLQRGSDKITPVFLLIDAQKVQSICRYGPEQTPDGVKRPDYNTICLRFQLSSLPSLIVPPDPLRLKDKSQQSLMRSVRWAARQSVLMVHIQEHALSEDQLTALSEAPYHQFTPSLRHSDIGRLYGGRGGNIFDAGADDGPADRPPSYNEVPAPPPIAPISYGSDTAASSNKRRRADSSADDSNVSLIENLCKKIAQEQFENIRSELSNMESRIIKRLDQGMSDRVRQLGETWEPRFKQLEGQVSELKSELETKTQELRDGTRELDDSCQAELQRLDDWIQEVSDDINHRVDFEVEDRVLGIKADMEDFVKDELANTADTLKQRIAEASVYIEFKE
ncbi:hypothetical protein N0V82_007034 [Gnomoniopsis sp. IMI 355080]|nr:hypothetical protein N0V82_007034 [Gnomoniopsis sp. IMI 355080]